MSRNKIENGLVWVEVNKKNPDHKIIVTADHNYCKCCDQMKWVINCVHEEIYQTRIWILCPECIVDTSLKKGRCICCNPSTSFEQYDVCDECIHKLIKNTQELYRVCNKPKECNCRFCKHLSRD